MRRLKLYETENRHSPHLKPRCPEVLTPSTPPPLNLTLPHQITPKPKVHILGAQPFWDRVVRGKQRISTKMDGKPTITVLRAVNLRPRVL